MHGLRTAKRHVDNPVQFVNEKDSITADWNGRDLASRDRSNEMRLFLRTITVANYCTLMSYPQRFSELSMHNRVMARFADCMDIDK